MKAALESSLQQAATSTFEQVVFVFPDTPPHAHQREVPVRVVASIAFSGPADGVLQVWACEGLLPRLTANMMGGMVIEDDALQMDALGEIANIICGQLFPTLAPDCAFKQMPPEVEPCSEEAQRFAPRPAARVELGVEDSRADVVLYLFEQAA